MNIDKRVILNSSFGKHGCITPIKYGLTIKDVRFARALFKAGFITWADAMDFLRGIYDENN